MRSCLFGEAVALDENVRVSAKRDIGQSIWLSAESRLDWVLKCLLSISDTDEQRQLLLCGDLSHERKRPHRQREQPLRPAPDGVGMLLSIAHESNKY